MIIYKQELNGISTTELAVSAQLSVSTLYERLRSPFTFSFKRIKKSVQKLNIDIAELIEGKEGTQNDSSRNSKLLAAYGIVITIISAIYIHHISREMEQEHERAERYKEKDTKPSNEERAIRSWMTPPEKRIGK